MKTNFVNHFKTNTKPRGNPPPPAETQGLTPFSNVPASSGQVPGSNITKAFLFTVAVSFEVENGLNDATFFSFQEDVLWEPQF